MSNNVLKQLPYIEIIEQPMQNGTRFRYESELKCKGKLLGENSTSEKKTYPAIEVKNYKGIMCVVVSCVTSNYPYYPHPCQLIGDDTRNGYYYKILTNDQRIELIDVGVVCPKKMSISHLLKSRKNDKVDPFGTGFKFDDIDKSIFRLCFQVFVEGNKKGSCDIPLPPIVSQPIYDKRQGEFLKICDLSHDSASMDGGKEIILLCERLKSDDVDVRFFEENTSFVIWEMMRKPLFHHKNVALIVTTPEYNINNINHEVTVQIQLKRLSDQKTSDAIPFQLKPSIKFKFYSTMKKRANCMESTDSMYARQYEPEGPGPVEINKGNCIQQPSSCSSNNLKVLNKKETKKQHAKQTLKNHSHINGTKMSNDYDVINSWESDLLPQEMSKLPPPLIPQKVTTLGIVKKDRPHVIIKEQPMKRGTRFRYESESKYSSCVIGEYSFEKNISYPAIDIIGNKEGGYLIVSCVTESQPHLAHPHKLIGKMTDKGIFRCNLRPCQTQIIFKDDYAFGIICVKKNDMKKSLSEREACRVDPFGGGFKHKDNLEIIDVSCVRLCFQVFILENGKNIPLKPVVSNPVYNNKSSVKPSIYRLSHSAAPVTGGTRIILLCTRIEERDIKIRFFDNNGWEQIIESPKHHKKVALIFQTPKYYKEIVDEPVQIHIQLERPSDKEKSDPRFFLFTPANSEKESLKKPKPMNSTLSSISFSRHQQPSMSLIKEADTCIENILAYLNQNVGTKNLEKEEVNSVNDDYQYGTINNDRWNLNPTYPTVSATQQMTAQQTNYAPMLPQNQMNIFYPESNAYNYDQSLTTNNENTYINPSNFQI